MELQKERQAKENALAQLQLAAERELENADLLQQLNTLQVCSHRQMQFSVYINNRCFFSYYISQFSQLAGSHDGFQPRRVKAG